MHVKGIIIMIPLIQNNNKSILFIKIKIKLG
jgi:hypothetical protein